MTPRHAARMTKREAEVVKAFMDGDTLDEVWMKAVMVYGMNNKEAHTFVQSAIRRSLRLQDRPKSKARSKK